MARKNEPARSGWRALEIPNRRSTAREKEAWGRTLRRRANAEHSGAARKKTRARLLTRKKAIALSARRANAFAEALGKDAVLEPALPSIKQLTAWLDEKAAEVDIDLMLLDYPRNDCLADLATYLVEVYGLPKKRVWRLLAVQYQMPMATVRRRYQRAANRQRELQDFPPSLSP